MLQKYFGNGRQSFYRILSISLILLSTSCVNNLQNDCNRTAPEIPQEDYLINSYGEPVGWHPDSFPIPVIISPSFDAFEITAIEQSIEYWNDITDEKIFQIVYGTSNIRRYSNNAIVLTKHPLQKRCENQLLGLASKRWVTNSFSEKIYILASRIEIHANHQHNSTYFRTVVHELGHALGLNHDRNDSSVMYPYINDQPWIIEDSDINFIIQSFWGLNSTR